MTFHRKVEARKHNPTAITSKYVWVMRMWTMSVFWWNVHKWITWPVILASSNFKTLLHDIKNVSTSKLAFMFFLHDVTLLSQILKVTPSSNNDCTGVTHRQSVCVSTLSSKCQVHPCSWSHEMMQVINGFWEREKKDYSYDLWHIFNLSSHLSGFMLLLTFQE